MAGSRKYLNPVDMGQLTTDGLRLDQDGPDHLGGPVAQHARLTSNGKPIGNSAPPANDAGGWAAVTAQAIERARLSSTTSSGIAGRHLSDRLRRHHGRLDAYSRYTSAKRAGNERAQREKAMAGRHRGR